MSLEIIKLRDFGLGRRLVAIWDGDTHIGQLEYRAINNGEKIVEVYALGIRKELRGKGWGRRVINEVVCNPSAKISNIERSAIGFWKKVLPESPSITKSRDK